MPKSRVNGIEIAYEDAGSGTPIFLLHGYPFNHSMWRDQVEVLKAGHRVVALDLRGLGTSELGVAPATMEQMACDVAALMDELQIRTTTIVGLSMGGYVALAFYCLYPERVQSLVLADSRAQADSDEGKRDRATQAAKALAEGMEGIADASLPKLLAPETLERRRDVVLFVRDMIIKTKPGGAAAALKGMAERRDQTALLSKISKPTLIIVGSQDILTPPQDSRAMHQAIPGSRLEILDGAAHLSNLEQPAEFNRLLLHFMNGPE